MIFSVVVESEEDMKVIERAVMPNGIEIQLEDWSENNTKKYPDLHGFTIGAYPVAKNTGKYRLIESGDKFRLQISMNQYRGYSNDDVKADFEALKNGEKSLEDLSDHFWNGEKDIWLLGMDVEYKGW